MARRLSIRTRPDGKMDIHILAIDDDPSFLLFLKIGLQKVCRLTTAETLKEALALIEADGIDVILLDIRLGEEDGLEILKRIKREKPSADVVMVSGYKDPKMIVESIRSGAADYLTKPFEIEELVAVLEKLRPVRSMRERHDALIDTFNQSLGLMVGGSEIFRKALQKASMVKGHKASILIEGESGTGKEMLARYIHTLEGDSARPFIAVNCAAIPENLLESELFGHERGSFTGAHVRKIGKFELANGGDIFLDEISCLKWELQAKILRALQEREITRIGGNESIVIDFRVLAATNDDLERLVEKGTFRRDLYHRLRVVQLRVPPLRERQDDIRRLVQHFLKKHDPSGKKYFSQDVHTAFRAYPWPGNIRELEHLVQSLVILSPQDEITRDDLPEWIFRRRPGTENPDTVGFVFPSGSLGMVPLKGYVSKAEQAYVQKVLEITRGDKSKAARMLKISRTRLYERLKVWGRGE